MIAARERDKGDGKTTLLLVFTQAEAERMRDNNVVIDLAKLVPGAAISLHITIDQDEAETIRRLGPGIADDAEIHASGFDIDGGPGDPQ